MPLSINSVWPKCDPDLYEVLCHSSYQEIEALVNNTWSTDAQIRSTISQILDDKQVASLRNWLIQVLLIARPDFVAPDMEAWNKWIAFVLAKLPGLFELAYPPFTYGQIANTMATNTQALNLLISASTSEVLYTNASVIWTFVLAGAASQIPPSNPILIPLIESIQGGRPTTGKKSGYGAPSERNVQNWIDKARADLGTLIAKYLISSQQPIFLRWLQSQSHSIESELALFAKRHGEFENIEIRSLARHALKQFYQERNMAVRFSSVAFKSLIPVDIISLMLANTHALTIPLSFILILISWIIVTTIFRFLLFTAFRHGRAALKTLNRAVQKQGYNNCVIGH